MSVLNQTQCEFGLAARFQTGAVVLAIFGNRLDHHAALVDLDGVDALVAVGITGFVYGVLKRAVQAGDAALNNLRKAQD